ncbi:hypothetical protein C8F01DRAFT_1139707 [Mycena amicta]|nr:hypothetical protein C8F01DRAFT_1139707 [Mycena amicta]
MHSRSNFAYKPSLVVLKALMLVHYAYLFIVFSFNRGVSAIALQTSPDKSIAYPTPLVKIMLAPTTYAVLTKTRSSASAPAFSSKSTASESSSTRSNGSQKSSTTATTTMATTTTTRDPNPPVIPQSALHTVAGSSITMSQTQSSSGTKPTSLGGASSTDSGIRVILPATLIPLFGVFLIAGIILLLRKFRHRPTTRIEPYRVHWQQRFVYERFGASRIKSLAEDRGESMLDTEPENVRVDPNTRRVSEDSLPSYHTR